MSVKAIRLSQHARDRLVPRGATEQEVIEAIRTAAWQRAELGRWECRKVFRANRQWHGRRYASKVVRPVFVEELREVVVVTVYVYFE